MAHMQRRRRPGGGRRRRLMRWARARTPRNTGGGHDAGCGRDGPQHWDEVAREGNGWRRQGGGGGGGRRWWWSPAPSFSLATSPPRDRAVAIGGLGRNREIGRNRAGGGGGGVMCVVPWRDPIAFGVSHFASSFFFLFHNCTFR